MSGSELHSLSIHLVEHILLVAISALAGLCISLPLAVFIAQSSKHSAFLATLGAFYTLPSLALFALLVPVLGLGTGTAIVVLTLYATVFLTRSITLALRALTPQIIEHALALGTTRLERLLRIELPMASPAIVAGVRTTCIMLIATASIAAWIDAGGLGVLLFEGLRQDDMRRVVIGSVAAALLAIVVDTLLATLENTMRRRIEAVAPAN